MATEKLIPAARQGATVFGDIPLWFEGGTLILDGENRMCYRLAVEDVEPNHWVAWALDLPACFSSAQTQANAVAHAPGRIADYYVWLSSHDSSLPVINDPVEVEVVETFYSFASSECPDYLVNAFFQDDRRPLAYWDVAVALRLLQWTHQDLLEVLRPVTQEQFNKPITGEVHGSIAGILEHIAGAENWYFGQLHLALDRMQFPKEPLDRLEAVRSNTQTQLVKLIGSECITEHCNELWSARKVIRRALWHERDHTQHIAQLLTRL